MLSNYLPVEDVSTYLYVYSIHNSYIIYIIWSNINLYNQINCAQTFLLNLKLTEMATHC